MGVLLRTEKRKQERFTMPLSIYIKNIFLIFIFLSLLVSTDARGGRGGGRGRGGGGFMFICVGNCAGWQVALMAITITIISCSCLVCICKSCRDDSDIEQREDLQNTNDSVHGHQELPYHIQPHKGGAHPHQLQELQVPHQYQHQVPWQKDHHPHTYNV